MYKYPGSDLRFLFKISTFSTETSLNVGFVIIWKVFLDFFEVKGFS